MHIEITSAADFLVHLLKLQKINKLNDAQLAMFKGTLSNLLRKRYQEHWFPDYPNKGSGYRCIRINGKMDPLISKAGAAIGLPAPTIRRLFPCELTLWIDPEEVSYRFGENGSICVLYERERPLVQSAPPPRQSPELYHDPRQFEQIDPMLDFVEVNC